MEDLKPIDILLLNEIEIARLVYSRISATYILRELFNSGLSMKPGLSHSKIFQKFVQI